MVGIALRFVNEFTRSIFKLTPTILWACNAKKSGSGDQTYLRTECERGMTGDETTWGPRTRFHVASIISSPDTKWRPKESLNVSLPVHREDG